MLVDGQQVLYGSVEYVRLGKHEGFHLLLGDEFYGKLIFQQVTQGNYIPTFDQHTPSLDDIFKMKVGESHE